MVARARKYLDEKRYDDAIVVLTQSGAGGSSKSSMEERQVLALAHDKKASMLLENDRLDEAVEHYRKAVALNPGDGGLHLRLGNALYYCGVLSQDKDSQKHLRDALSELTASLEIDRNNVHAYERLATVYEALRDNEQARTAWGQVLKLAPPGETADLAKGRISQLARNH